MGRINPNPGKSRESLERAKARVAYFEALLDEHGTAYWNDSTNWIELREQFERSRAAAETALAREHASRRSVVAPFGAAKTVSKSEEHRQEPL